MSFGDLDLAKIVEQLSELATMIIGCACAVHVFAFFVLTFWSKRDLRRIAESLDDFTRDLRYRSVLGKTSHLSDQIEAFIADVTDVLGDPSRSDDRRALLHRMSILDEKRRYLDSMLFETSYNICRTMIEAYPLAGVLGTVLAIGAALSGGADPASSMAGIVERFGDAIWSTFAGLASAILLMFINSAVETPFQRLSSNRTHVRDVVARAKRELALTTSSEETASPSAATLGVPASSSDTNT